MNQPRGGFVLRSYSRFPVRTSMMYLGQEFAGQGIVRELSRVGCRILGNYPVVFGETMSLRIALPTSPNPLFIQRATVQWITGLEFGVAFGLLDAFEADRLQRLLDELLDSGRYSDLPIPSPEGEACLDGPCAPQLSSV